MSTKTYIPKASEIEKKWYLIDADGQILGRLAVKVASLLMGKGKVLYTPHLDCGDYVVVVNAAKVRVTGKKAKDKVYSHYTGYPGGLREYNFETLLAKKPKEVITRAVERMMPNNRLRAKRMKHLHVYADGTHRHQAAQLTLLK